MLSNHHLPDKKMTRSVRRSENKRLIITYTALTQHKDQSGRVGINRLLLLKLESGVTVDSR